MGRQGYPAEFRRRALDLVAAGKTVAEVARLLEVSDQSIYSWRRQEQIDRGELPGLSSAEREELRAAGVDVPQARVEPLDRGVEVGAFELVAVVGEDALEPPARLFELARDALGELGGLLRGRVALAADDELGPGEGGVDVDRGQLPDGALCAAKPPQVEAVDPDQLTRMINLDMRLR